VSGDAAPQRAVPCGPGRGGLRCSGARGLVAFPTETVYGLGALALEPLAVRPSTAAKSQAPDQPPDRPRARRGRSAASVSALANGSAATCGALLAGPSHAGASRTAIVRTSARRREPWGSARHASCRAGLLQRVGAPLAAQAPTALSTCRRQLRRSAATSTAGSTRWWTEALSLRHRVTVLSLRTERRVCCDGSDSAKRRNRRSDRPSRDLGAAPWRSRPASSAGIMRRRRGSPCRAFRSWRRSQRHSMGASARCFAGTLQPPPAVAVAPVPTILKVTPAGLRRLPRPGGRRLQRHPGGAGARRARLERPCGDRLSRAAGS